MITRTGLVLAGLFALAAVSCGDSAQPSADSSKPAGSSAPAKSAKPAASATSKATASAATSATAAPSGSADADACPPNEKWEPKTAKDVKFEWSDKPKLDQAPKDGVYASVGGDAFKLDEVTLSVDGKTKEWTLSGKAGPLGPNLIIKGEPKANATVDEKFGSNRGYFQVPKGDVAQCFKQTTSYNGENARIIKLTKYDDKAKLADGVFVTTWQEGFDKKRKFWAAGTFKDAKVNVY